MPNGGKLEGGEVRCEIIRTIPSKSPQPVQEQQRHVAFDGNCHCVERGNSSPVSTEVNYGRVYPTWRKKMSALKPRDLP